MCYSKFYKFLQIPGFTWLLINYLLQSQKNRGNDDSSYNVKSMFFCIISITISKYTMYAAKK